MSSLGRRHFLQASAALGGVLVSAGIRQAAGAAPVRIDTPVPEREFKPVEATIGSP